MTTDYRTRVLDPHPALRRVYGTAFEAVRPESIQSDMLLGLLADDAPMLTGWHQIVRVREDMSDGVGGDIRNVYFRTFDLLDGEDLGRSYKERQFAKHVTMKARVHWAQRQDDVYAHVREVSGFFVHEFTHESVYFTAIARIRNPYVIETLRCMRSLHVSLVRNRQLQEK